MMVRDTNVVLFCRQMYRWKRLVRIYGSLTRRYSLVSMHDLRSVRFSPLNYQLTSRNRASIIYQGLIVSSRKETLQHFKKPWAHDHKPIRELVNAVNV